MHIDYFLKITKFNKIKEYIKDSIKQVYEYAY
jgi:hypothetical protein